MHTVRFLLISLLFLLTSQLVACNSARPPESSFVEVVGDQPKRVSTVTAMLTKFHIPPTPILDAQFVEEKIGDDELGPADYRTFTQIAVAPADIPTWQALLTPLDAAPAYSAPPQAYTWWVQEDAFNALQFYAPDTFSNRTNGWIAIDAQSGMIYIYSFTT